MVVAAAAAITGSATFSGVGTRSQDALVASAATSGIVASPTHIHKGTSLVGGCSGWLSASASHQKTARADVTGSGELRAFVYRSAEGGAYLTGTASILVIPASVLGRSDLAPASALVWAEATKVHPGKSDATGAATVVLQSNPTVTRYVSSDVLLGKSSFYAETAINGIGEAFAAVPCTAEVTAQLTGLVTRPAHAWMDSAAGLHANATYIQLSKSQLDSTSSLVVTQPHIEIGGLAQTGGEAHFQANATSIKQAQAATSMSGASVNIAPSISHGSAKSASVNGAAQVSASGIRKTLANASAYCQASLTATGLRAFLPEAIANTMAGVSAQAVRYVFAVNGSFSSSANVAVQANTTIRQGTSNLIGSSSFAATDSVYRIGLANVIGSADLLADSFRFIEASANLVGIASFQADSISNPYSSDPVNRTFNKPMQATDFVRITKATEFMRPA